MCGASAAQKVGYMNRSDGAAPLCHVGTFWGLASTVVTLCLFLFVLDDA